MSYFNTNLPFIRKKKGISQLELAKKIGVDQSTVSLWEKGMDTTIDNACKVAEVLNISIPELLGKDLRFDNAEQLNNEESIKIPIFGVITAGTPIEAQQNILDYVDIPVEMTKGDKKYYGLKIKGDSMYPKYLENDIVIFEQIDDYMKANKKDCAVMVNGYDATFKNVTITENSITLTPLNPLNADGYTPTTYTKEEIINLPVKIIGIAVEKRTKL